MLGFTGDAVVSDIKGAKVQRFDATYSAVMALENGKVDAVVADSEPAKIYRKLQRLIHCFCQSGRRRLRNCCSKNDKVLLENLNKAMEKVKANGTYDALLKNILNRGGNMKIDVFLTAEEAKRKEIHDSNIVVIDVLRATSVMITAMAHGVSKIHPYESIEEVREASLASSFQFYAEREKDLPYMALTMEILLWSIKKITYEVQKCS